VNGLATEIEQLVRSFGSDNVMMFGGSYEGGIHCQQVPDEIAALIGAVMQSGEDCKSYLEIGAAAGATAYLFHRIIGVERIVLIDDNQHPKAILRDRVLAGIDRLEIIGRSADDGTVAQAAALAPYDIVMIDADHSYSGARLDVDLYLPMLRPGGFLVMHDTAPREFGVHLVVAELVRDDRVRLVGEFLSAKHYRPLGLALFQLIEKDGRA
jgi:predicted O-methyltransferase YrrM